MKERKRKLAFREDIDVYDFFNNETLDNIAAKVSALQARFEEEIFNKDYYVNFEVDYYGYDGGLNVYLNVWRPENDKEYNDRLEKERKAAEKAKKISEGKKEAARKRLMKTEEDERAEYERLRAKFENTT